MRVTTLIRSWMVGAAAIGGVLAVQGLQAAEPAKPQASSSCAPDGNVKFICGLGSPEDLILVPGTPWVLASGMADAATHQSALYAIDPKSQAFQVVYPIAGAKTNHDKQRYGECPGPLPGTTFGAHGIDVQPKGNGLHAVYAVNHAVRETIEIFDLDAKGARPALTWVGCVVLPKKASGNGVIGLPDGGFITTNFKDPADTEAFKHMTEMKVTGEVLEWHPGKGWTTLPDSAMSGANGLALSKDGNSLYVAGWPGKNVTRWEKGASGWAKKESISTGILTDNLRWLPDGALLAGGQDSSMPAVFECRPPQCRVGSAAIRIDLATGKTSRLAAYPGSEAFEGGTTALQVGNEVWFGSFKGTRIARVPLTK